VRLRLGTFNAKFLPTVLPVRDRARRLAERVAASEYDLIAFSEVFDERARRVLVAELASQFPHNVAYLGSRRWLREDSGLMLFSRLPFDRLPRATNHRALKSSASNDGGATPWSEVAFLEFGDSADSDRLAAKGIAYVRATLEERPLNVFFTHMQASYWRDGPRGRRHKVEVRRRQLAEIRQFVLDVLGEERAHSENVIFVGDFNVEGDVRQRSAPELSNGVDEWSHMMDRLGSLFPAGLTDVWDAHAPPGDRGLTYRVSEPRHRFDYVLLSGADPIRPLCVRGVAIADNLRDVSQLGAEDSGATSSGHLSDHWGLNADLYYGDRQADARRAAAGS
jgi:hypothetical protein